jgi:hypothetical protein
MHQVNRRISFCFGNRSGAGHDDDPGGRGGLGDQQFSAKTIGHDRTIIQAAGVYCPLAPEIPFRRDVVAVTAPFILKGKTSSVSEFTICVVHNIPCVHS